MNNLKMLEMALNALKQCTSNEWVESRTGERYNIEAVLAKIQKSSVETYSEQIQNELEPLDAKSKLHDKTGIPASGNYVNNLPRLMIEGGMIVEVDGVPVDWTFATTDDDCEFEDTGSTEI